jgi:type 1 glutamine amidotransferase
MMLTSFTSSHSTSSNVVPAKKMKALIIDGENNHGVWPKTTIMLKDFLEETGLFEVDIERTKYTWQGPHHNVKDPEDVTALLDMYPIPSDKQTVVVEEPKPDPDFSPKFSNYDVIISNLGWKASTWQPQVKEAFESYIKNGGGLVIIHAANNSWGDWDEYNKMIGIGGWGGRNTETGPYVYYDNDGKLHKDPSEGNCGSHGAQHEFVLQTRAPKHPIMKGLPEIWLHTKDELYERLRGPAENITVLATSFSDSVENTQRTGRHEPMLLAIEYGKGRIFHTALGHMDYSMECVGFMTTFQRASEWVATGKVKQKVPKDFPTAEMTSVRPWNK